MQTSLSLVLMEVPESFYIEKTAWNRIRNLIWTRRLCCLKADFAVSFN